MLTRLFRLIIHFEDTEIDLIDVYGFIFNLPVLEYNKISVPFARSILFSSNIIPKQSSSIKHLVIDYRCTIGNLSLILAYAPQLRRLNLNKSLYSSVHIISSQILSNLTHLCINKCDIHFDQFEILIIKISSQLQVLKLSTFDHSYLDANRWEQLISQHMTQLRRFYFQHRESSDNNPQLINEFTSPFWIDRQWIFDITVDGLEFIYSVQPYRYLVESYTLNRDLLISFRKRWFEFDKLDNHDYSFTQNGTQTEMQRKDIINPSIQSDKNVQLTVTHRFTQASMRLLINKINSISTMVEITCLDIDCSKILTQTLINLINLLPHLDSLRISYLPLPEIQNIPVLQKNKNITKINFEQMFDMEQIQFLIQLCPCVQYLIINCTSCPTESNPSLPRSVGRKRRFQRLRRALVSASGLVTQCVLHNDSENNNRRTYLSPTNLYSSQSNNDDRTSDIYLIPYIQSILKSFKCLILLTLNILSVSNMIVPKIQTMINKEYRHYYTIERINNQIILRRNIQ